MSEIFIDHDCKVCSTYGNWINNKNNDMKINDQKNLSINEINLDTLVYKNQNKVFYYSDAVIMSVASGLSLMFEPSEAPESFTLNLNVSDPLKLK